MSQRSFDKFNVYIIRLVKSSRKITISNDCKDTINQLIYYLLHKYTTAAIELCNYANKITIDSTALITATSIWLTDYKNITDYAKNAWDSYANNTVRNLKKHDRAGLILPPSRFHKFLKEHKLSNQKISETADIFLTAIIEYLLKNIITVALEYAINEKLSSKHIYLAINSAKLVGIKPLFKNIFMTGLTNLALKYNE